MDKKSLDNYIKSPSPIKKELKILFSHKKALVIFDIGSCEGEDSIRYSGLFPNSKIYSFEALPKNQKLLKENFKKCSINNATLFPIALSDKKGISDFYVSYGQPQHDASNPHWDYGNKSSSLLEPDETYKKHEWLKFGTSIKVETDTLKNICESTNIKEIDFIHMDVQGAELKVLIGAEEIINNIKAIWLEVENVSLYKNQPLKNDVEEFFFKNNFIKIKDTVNNISGDQLYINTKYFDGYKIILIKLLHLAQKQIKTIQKVLSALKRLLTKIKKTIIR